MSVQNASHAVLEEVATGGVSLWCEECGIKVVAYKGESGRNGFRQGEEHLDNKATKDEEKSILWAHSVHHHNSREDMVYMMRVTGANKDQCSERRRGGENPARRSPGGRRTEITIQPPFC